MPSCLHCLFVSPLPCPQWRPFLTPPPPHQECSLPGHDITSLQFLTYLSCAVPPPPAPAQQESLAVPTRHPSSGAGPETLDFSPRKEGMERVTGLSQDSRCFSKTFACDFALIACGLGVLGGARLYSLGDINWRGCRYLFIGEPLSVPREFSSVAEFEVTCAPRHNPSAMPFRYTQ